jgi:hypothetical protein
MKTWKVNIPKWIPSIMMLVMMLTMMLTNVGSDVDHVICYNIQVKGLAIKHWFKLAPCYLASLWIWFATFTNDDGKLLYNPKMGALSK